MTGKKYLVILLIILICSNCKNRPLTDSDSGGFLNSPKQNIVLINVDDLGYGDLSCYGATRVSTPNIDKLATQGCSFIDSHSCSAVCSPSRYGLMTGRYPSRSDLYYPVFARVPSIVDTSCMTIARVMKQAGYATAAIGKWHLGFGTEQPVDWKMGHHMNSDKLLGFKFDAWEGGNLVPFIARWPGKIKPGTTSNELLSNVDLLATFAAITGYMLKDGEGPDSYNGLPSLLGTVEKPVRDFLVISPAQKKNLAIRKGKWMHISSQGGGGFTGQNIGDHGLGGAAATLLTGQVNSDIEKGQIKPGAPRAQLYNLEEDLAENRNLYHEYPRVVEELEALLHSAINENESTRPQ